MKKEKVQTTLTVFLADDDEDDVYFITKAFSESNPDAKLIRFGNGQLLLDGLKKSTLPELVLLDLNMPLLDGRETLRVLKESFGNRVPVIVLSTSNHYHEQELCREYGADSYFIKPFSYDGYIQIFRTLRAEWFHKELV